MLTDAPDGFALMSAEEEVKEMQAISFLTENRFPPTIAILDIGCTRAMGSRRAVDFFVTMSTIIQTVDYGTLLSLPRASFTLPTLRRLLALRNW